MLGWKIFAHSVRMVFGNLRQVLQITVGPALAATLLIVGSVFALGIPLEAFDDSATGLPPGVSAGSFVLFLLVFMAVLMVTTFWIAVSWHRFILLEEYPSGLFPTFRFDRILAYLGRGLLLGLLMIIAFLPMGLLLAAISESSPISSFILLFAYMIFLVICFYRLSIILPSAAIGQPLSLTEAWSRTTGTAGVMVVVLLAALLFQFLVQLVSMILGFVPILGVLFVLFVSLLILPMINVSILTTLYGVFVEKRELS